MNTPPEISRPRRNLALFWSRNKRSIQVYCILVVAWGPATINSLSIYFGFDPSDNLLLGRPANTVGEWLLVGIHIITTCAISFAYVKPSRLGFSSPTEWRTEARIFAIACLAIFFAAYAKSMLLEVFQPPFTGGRIVVDNWLLVGWSIEAGIMEEIAMAAMIILMMRARTSTAWTISTMVSLRTVFHLYQGGAAVLTTGIFVGTFAYLFIKYRRVIPLVLAHITFDVVASWGALPW